MGFRRMDRDCAVCSLVTFPENVRLRSTLNLSYFLVLCRELKRTKYSESVAPFVGLSVFECLRQDVLSDNVSDSKKSCEIDGIY